MRNFATHLLLVLVTMFPAYAVAEDDPVSGEQILQRALSEVTSPSENYSPLEVEARLSEIRSEVISAEAISRLRADAVERSMGETRSYIDRILIIFVAAVAIISYLMFMNIRHQNRSMVEKLRRLSREAEGKMSKIDQILLSPEVGHYRASQRMRQILDAVKERGSDMLSQSAMRDIYSIAEDPNLPASLYLQANAMKAQQSGNWREAIAYWERLSMMDNQSGDVHLQLANAYKSMASVSSGAEHDTYLQRSLEQYQQYVARTKGLRMTSANLEKAYASPLPSSEQHEQRLADSPSQAPRARASETASVPVSANSSTGTPKLEQSRKNGKTIIPTTVPLRNPPISRPLSVSPKSLESGAPTHSRLRVALQNQVQQEVETTQAGDESIFENGDIIRSNSNEADYYEQGQEYQSNGLGKKFVGGIVNKAGNIGAGVSSALAKTTTKVGGRISSVLDNYRRADYIKQRETEELLGEGSAETMDTDLTVTNGKNSDRLRSLGQRGQNGNASNSRRGGSPANKPFVARNKFVEEEREQNHIPSEQETSVELTASEEEHSPNQEELPASKAIETKKGSAAGKKTKLSPEVSAKRKLDKADKMVLKSNETEGDVAMQHLNKALKLYEDAHKANTTSDLYRKWGIALISKGLRMNGDAEEWFDSAAEKFIAGNKLSAGSFDFQLASLYAIAGNEDQCKHWLEIAQDAGKIDQTLLKENPDFDGMRDKEWFSTYISS